MKSPTVTVNGTVYDSETGMPLRHERTEVHVHKHTAQKVHAGPQRSKTLNRRYVQHSNEPKPDAQPKVAQVTSAAPPAISVHRTPAAAHRPARSEHITKFAKTPTSQHKSRQVGGDIGPTPHALASAAAQRVQHAKNVQKPAQVAIKPSQVIKQEAIHHAMAATTPKAHKKEVKQAKKHARTHRFASIASASIAIVLLAGYFTYLNMPALSTRVAASQAGIDASYPAYQPNGYRLDGPVVYEQGSVSMLFAANAGPQSYTLTQSDSDWDSSAVLENNVLPGASGEYMTTTTSGLTIYHYDNKSVWVNNGILYTISGDASLSNDQIQRIATSL